MVRRLLLVPSPRPSCERAARRRCLVEEGRREEETDGRPQDSGMYSTETQLDLLHPTCTMWTFDLVIKNAIVATASDEFRSEIGIKDGKIALLAPEIPVDGSCEVIDAEGGYVTVRPCCRPLLRSKR